MTKRSRVALSVGLVAVAMVFGATRAMTLGQSALMGVFVAVVGLILYLAWRFIGARADDDDDDPGDWWGG